MYFVLLYHFFASLRRWLAVRRKIKEAEASKLLKKTGPGSFPETGDSSSCSTRHCDGLGLLLPQPRLPGELLDVILEPAAQLLGDFETAGFGARHLGVHRIHAA